MNDFEEEIVDNDEISNFVKEIKVLITEGEHKNDSIEDLKKDYADEVEKLEEALLNYIGENDLKILKTEFPKKPAYPSECSNCIEDYQKPVDNLKKEDFFSKLKNDYPRDKETERTK